MVISVGDKLPVMAFGHPVYKVSPAAFKCVYSRFSCLFACQLAMVVWAFFLKFLWLILFPLPPSFYTKSAWRPAQRSGLQVRRKRQMKRRAAATTTARAAVRPAHRRRPVVACASAAPLSVSINACSCCLAPRLMRFFFPVDSSWFIQAPIEAHPFTLPNHKAVPKTISRPFRSYPAVQSCPQLLRRSRTATGQERPTLVGNSYRCIQLAPANVVDSLQLAPQLARICPGRIQVRIVFRRLQLFPLFLLLVSVRHHLLLCLFVIQRLARRRPATALVEWRKFSEADNVSTG